MRNNIRTCLSLGKGIIVFSLLFVYAADASSEVRIERGSEQIVAGHAIFAWARMSGAEVIEAGVTIPFALIQNPPGEKGSGPAGAIAVVAFPESVRDTTFLDHFQIHWEEQGHEPPVFMVPHFDLHFYGVSPEEVLQVSAPDPNPPAVERIPAGFIYPGPDYVHPQMGVHSFRPADLEAPFSDVLILGYYGGRMTFIEPMVTRKALIDRHPISHDIPVPAAMGERTRFPTRFTLEHDPASGACHLKLSAFVTTAP